MNTILKDLKYLNIILKGSRNFDIILNYLRNNNIILKYLKNLDLILKDLKYLDIALKDLRDFIIVLKDLKNLDIILKDLKDLIITSKIWKSSKGKFNLSINFRNTFTRVKNLRRFIIILKDSKKNNLIYSLEKFINILNRIENIKDKFILRRGAILFYFYKKLIKLGFIRDINLKSK